MTITLARSVSRPVSVLYCFCLHSTPPLHDQPTNSIEDENGNVKKGSKGISCFFLKVRNEDGSLNNIQIARLKDKLGTKQLPTAELELQGARAVLISAENRGIATIVTLVNVTRLYNSVSAAAGMRRILALAEDYADKRMVFGKVAVVLFIEFLPNCHC